MKAENTAVDNCKANFAVDLALVIWGNLSDLVKQNIAWTFVGVNSDCASVLSSKIEGKNNHNLMTVLTHIVTILLILTFKKFRTHCSVCVSNKFSLSL